MDLNFFKKSIPTLAIMGIFSVIMIYAIYSLLTPEKKLPVYNPADVNPKLVDQSLVLIRRNHKVLDFSLINQNGETVTQQDYEGKIYVADFFFTRCMTICPVMTNNMGVLQEEFLNDDDVKFLSHSVTPSIDSVSVLKTYAEKNGVIDSKWHLVTGDKTEIYNLGRNEYFVENDLGIPKDINDFLHTENFLLIDKNKHIRGIYNGLNRASIAQLITDVEALLKEI
mgnify:CR=1 FL=1